MPQHPETFIDLTDLFDHSDLHQRIRDVGLADISSFELVTSGHEDSEPINDESSRAILIAPALVWFSVDASPLHRFDPSCSEAVKLIREGIDSNLPFALANDAWLRHFRPRESSPCCDICLQRAQSLRLRTSHSMEEQ